MKVTIGKYPIKYSTKRNIKIQIDEWDTWSLDHTLALVILPALRQYQKDSKEVGHPCGLAPRKRPPKNGCGKCGCEKKWHEILDKMIWSFEQITKDDVLAVDVKNYKKYQERIQEGLDLFAKYFRSLWT